MRWLPIVGVASLARRLWAFLVLVRAPAARRARSWWCFSGKCGGLPEEAGELARAGDRDDAGRFASLPLEVLPALVQAPLAAPGDLEHARVLVLLAAGERLADARRVAVVVGRLDQEPAGVAGAGLGDRALAAPLVRAALRADDPVQAPPGPG